MTFKSQKNSLFDFIFLSALSGFFLIFKLGSGSLASWDEAIYAAVAKELVRSGDWLRFTLDGQPWFDKPPLCIWATAFFYKLFGINEFSARFFSALCGVGAVIVTYLLGTRLFSRWVGFIAGLVLLSSSHFFRFSRFGMMDAPLTFFLSLSLYFFLMGHEKNRYFIFSGLAIGLALMAKGFAAFFIFPIIWFYCLFTDELELLGRSSYWIGVMIAVAIALPWNLYETLVNRGAFVQDTLFKHLFTRTTTALDGHVGNYYFYIRTLVNKFHPWILVGIVSGPYFIFRAIKEKTEEFIFPAVWMLVVLIVITLIQTKLSWYILPLYPPLCITVAYVLAKIFKENQRNFIRAMFLVVMILHIPYSNIFGHDYSPGIKAIAPAIQSQMPGEKTIYLYNYHESPAASFYLDKQSLYLDDEEALMNAAKEPKFFCLIREQDLLPVKARLERLGVFVRDSARGLHLIAKKI